MDVKKPIFCGLAFGSASINSYGEYIPCCNIRTEHWNMYVHNPQIYDHGALNADPKGRINASNLRSLRKQLINGEWPKACYNCKEAEDAGVFSMRNIWNKTLTEEHNNDIPMNEVVDPNQIYYLDLTFSTKCNSKCMTCGPDLSDFWQEEHEIIWSEKNYQKKTFKRICIDDDSAKKILRDFPNVRKISFIGGEPTISEEHIRFLKLLVENKRSKNIELNYVTNLTGFNDDMASLWKNFKAVFVSVSVDGYNRVNEYIRYPIKWNKCENNIRQFLKMAKESADNSYYTDRTIFTIGLSCTVSVFNAVQCIDLFEFWFDMLTEYKTKKSSLVENVGCFANRVSWPQYIRIGLLSKEYRQSGINKGNLLLDKIKDYENNNPETKVNEGIIDSIKLVMTWLEDEEITDEKMHSTLRHLVTESDKFRNRKLKDYMPELQDELEKQWEKYARGTIQL